MTVQHKENQNAAEEKARLRREARGQLRALSPDDRRNSDDALFAAFLSLPPLETAQTVLLFYGVGTEPDTRRLFAPLWARGKRLCLPRCLPGNTMEIFEIQPDTVLRPGFGGIPEPGADCGLPLARGDVELILVPALCCDRRGFRLGQGGGYYDRYLAANPRGTVCLCRRALLRQALPAEPWDIAAEWILTEDGARAGLRP
jgi:5-formyltetrahydrofolate cyclo-ligase